MQPWRCPARMPGYFIMRYALINNARSLPKLLPPGTLPRCAACGGEVVACLGSVRVHHWRHKSLVDCDSWHEEMTDWHIKFQALVPESWREIVIKKNDIIHRADIRHPETGRVVEVQHSRLSRREIIERENFYDNMIWIFDARTFGIRVYGKMNSSDYRCTNLQTSILSATRPVFFDVGGYILYVKSIRKSIDKRRKKYAPRHGGYDLTATPLLYDDFKSLFLTQERGSECFQPTVA